MFAPRSATSRSAGRAIDDRQKLEGDRGLLVKALGMLASEHEGERAAAALQVDRIEFDYRNATREIS